MSYYCSPLAEYLMVYQYSNIYFISFILNFQLSILVLAIVPFPFINLQAEPTGDDQEPAEESAAAKKRRKKQKQKERKEQEEAGLIPKESEPAEGAAEEVCSRDFIVTLGGCIS